MKTFSDRIYRQNDCIEGNELQYSFVILHQKNGKFTIVCCCILRSNVTCLVTFEKKIYQYL